MNAPILQIAHINLHVKPELEATESLVEKLVLSVDNSDHFDNPAIALDGADNINVMLDFNPSSAGTSFESSFFAMIKELGFGSFTLTTEAA